MAEFPTAPEAPFEEARKVKRDFDPSPYRRSLRSLRVGDAKLIRASDGRDELYVLSEDPGEQHNRIAERRELADSLSAELDRMLVGRIAGRAGRGSGSGAVMTEQQKEVLRSLGYIGGAKGDSSTGAGGAAAQDTTGTANDR